MFVFDVSGKKYLTISNNLIPLMDAIWKDTYEKMGVPRVEILQISKQMNLPADAVQQIKFLPQFLPVQTNGQKRMRICAWFGGTDCSCCTRKTCWRKRSFGIR